MELKTITAATTTPISLEEAKDHLYLTATDRDADVVRKIREATDYCERRVPGGRQFMTAVYEAVLPDFPDDSYDAEMRITLPCPPLQKVNFIKYRAASDGTLTTYGTTGGSTGSTGYYNTVKPTHDPGFVVPAYSKTWPSVRSQPDAVTVRFTAGYTSGSCVPGTIKSAVKLKLEQLFDPDRVDEQKMDRAIDALLRSNGYGAY
jgi:hypothetical protein